MRHFINNYRNCRRQNINQVMDPQKTHHASPWRASYGVSFVNICEKIDRLITAPHRTFRSCNNWYSRAVPDSKVHGANMGPTWVLSAPDAPRVGRMNLAIRVITKDIQCSLCYVTLTDTVNFCMPLTNWPWPLTLYQRTPGEWRCVVKNGATNETPA